VGILLQSSQICPTSRQMGAKVGIYRSLPYCRHSVTCYCAAPTKQRSQDYDGPCKQSETVKYQRAGFLASRAPKSESSLGELMTKRRWSRRPMTNPLTSSMLSPNLKERAFQESTMKSMELDHWKDQDARYEHRST